jgi:hypothetical protein
VRFGLQPLDALERGTQLLRDFAAAVLRFLEFFFQRCDLLHLFVVHGRAAARLLLDGAQFCELRLQLGDRSLARGKGGRCAPERGPRGLERTRL